MKSTFSLMTGGAAAVWKVTPTFIKVPFAIGVAMLATAELTRDVNEAWRSSRIFEGQGVQGDAQASNPVKTLADLKAGKPTPAASAMIAVQFEGQAADARIKTADAAAATEGEKTLRTKDGEGSASSAEQLRLRELDLKAREIALREREIALRETETRAKTAEADSMNESEEELLRKQRRGVKLTATENLKLQEIRRNRAEAQIADIKAGFIAEIVGGGADKVIEAGKRQADSQIPYLGSKPQPAKRNSGMSNCTQRTYDKAMNAITGATP